MGDFFSDHPRSSQGGADKGPMLAPHIAGPLLSEAMGESRHQTDAVNQLWDSTVLVTTGVTRGSSKLAK